MRPALALALACLAGTAGAAPRLVERVVATVGSEVLTFSRLEFESRVELIRRGGRDAATAALPHDVLNENLTLAIGQRLAQAEADRLGIYDVDQKELDDALNEFRANLAPLHLEQFLALNEISQGEFQRLLRRDVQADKYLTSRAQLRAPISDAEVEGFIAGHAAEVGPKPSREVREAIRANLARTRNQELVRNELRRLYGKAKVRIVDPGFSGADRAFRADSSGG